MADRKRPPGAGPLWAAVLIIFAAACFWACGDAGEGEDDGNTSDDGVVTDDGGASDDGGSDDAAADGSDVAGDIPEEGDPDPRTYEERVVLYLTNCVRADPAWFNENWGFRTTPAPAPSRPLLHQAGLHAAARFQAEHIDRECTLCDDHTSCCELGLVDGQVQCVGPVGGCGGTGWRERVLFWYDHPSGENAASGPRSPEMAVQAWVSSGGHFDNMNESHTLLGVGRSNDIWVQDFGTGEAPAAPLAEGIHYRRVIIEGSSGFYTITLDSSNNRVFGVTYYDPGMGAPDSIYVLLDGEQHDLALAHGTPDHGAYETEIEVTDECRAYVFHVTDSAGAEHIFPAAGHLNAALVMDEACPAYTP